MGNTQESACYYVYKCVSVSFQSAYNYALSLWHDHFSPVPSQPIEQYAVMFGATNLLLFKSKFNYTFGCLCTSVFYLIL